MLATPCSPVVAVAQRDSLTTVYTATYTCNYTTTNACIFMMPMKEYALSAVLPMHACTLGDYTFVLFGS